MKKLLLASTALVGAFTLIDRAEAQQLTTDSPFTVRIDGFATFKGAIVNQSNTTPVLASSGNPFRVNAAQQQPNGGRSDSFRPDTEIHITATGKADNGLVYGMYVEIEADPNQNATATGVINGGAAAGTITVVSTHAVTPVDEANIFLQGSWGRFEAGDQDGAVDQLFFGPPRDYGPAWGGSSGADSDVMQRFMSGIGVRVATSSAFFGGGPLYSFNIQALDSSDATKITYLSPVIAGFRAGVSFAPDGVGGNQPSIGCAGASNLCSTTISSLTPAQTTLLAGNAAVAPAALATLGRASVPAVFGAYGDFQHWIEAGAQWRGTVGDVGLGAYAGFTHAEHKKSVFTPLSGAAGSLTTSAGLGTGLNSTLAQGPYNFIDINSYAVGGQVSWMGITVGGSYSNHGRSTYLTGPFLNRGSDAYAYTAGIQYAIGPWVVGYNYSFTFDAGGTVSPWACAFGETGLTAAGAANTAAVAGPNTRPCQGSDVELHSVGGKYILAPGLSLFAEYVNATVVVNGVTVNTGDVGIAGIAVRF